MLKDYFIYTAEIKENGNDKILTPSYHGQRMSRKDLIELWGLDRDDVEWYKLYEVLDSGNKFELIY